MLKLTGAAAWPSFSFCDVLRPEPGWDLEHAVVATYSADCTAIVTALLAMSGCDLDHRRTGSRVEVVRAIEKLEHRVRILVHPNRVALPHAPPPIVRLLDRVIRQIPPKDAHSSWHPKVALLRFTCGNRQSNIESQWRLWIGSRNLTRSSNWEAGAVLVSRSDNLGKRVKGIPDLGKALVARADLPNFSQHEVKRVLETLTWECPPGTEFESVRLLGDVQTNSFPASMAEANQIMLVSPFLDAKVIHDVGRWGSPDAHRTLLSTVGELNRLHKANAKVFAGFNDVLWCERPEISGQGAGGQGDETNTSAAEISESEESPPTGLHAKLIYSAKGSHRHLWLGSANATRRAWDGRNYEVVAEVRLTRNEPIEALRNFVRSCALFTPVDNFPDDDPDEIELENARDVLALHWMPTQRLEEDHPIVASSDPPEFGNDKIHMEVATLGQSWTTWPQGARSVTLPKVFPWQQTDLLQVRLTLRDRACGWVQLARFCPPIEQSRDRAVIGQYLDPVSYFLWLRSLLAGTPREGGGDWDAGIETRGSNSYISEAPSSVPTLEEILRAWSRDPAAFSDANVKVTDYLSEVQKRASAAGMTADAKTLSDFAATWSTLVAGLS